MYDFLTAHATACIQEMYLHGYWSRRIHKLFTVHDIHLTWRAGLPDSLARNDFKS